MNVEELTNNYETYLIRLGYATSTIHHNKAALERFLKHLKTQEVNELTEIKPTHLHAYNDYLHGLKSRVTQRGLASSTIQSKINVIKQFSQFLELTEQLKIYTVKLETVPTVKQHRNILSQAEIKTLYKQCDNGIKGLRNKAILGLYYGCGLRYREGINLETSQIDYKKAVLYVAPSKNYKSRFVPINKAVLNDFLNYESYARDCFKDRGNYFLSGSVSNTFFSSLLHKLCEDAGIERKISLHSLRHSIATHLLQKQMPLEQIAKFLGHTTLRATEIYTRIVLENEQTDESKTE
jgi:integrase/recombinase XerD